MQVCTLVYIPQNSKLLTHCLVKLLCIKYVCDQNSLFYDLFNLGINNAQVELSNKIEYIFTMYVKFIFSKKATKNYKIFTVDLTLTKVWGLKKLTKLSERQIDGEAFVNFCGLFRKHELY